MAESALEGRSQPNFTIDQIQKLIPPNCFKRDNWTSFSYLLRDCLLTTLTFLLGAYALFKGNLSWWSSLIFWPIYILIQGTFLTALWVIAHECGHSAFSESQLINDTVGLIFHTLVLVPYWSWKFSHSLHHLYTNHIEKDETHVPPQYEDLVGFLPWNTFRVVTSMLKHYLFGWIAYLTFNVSSSPLYQEHVDHFNPWCPLFTKKQRPYVIASDIALLTFGFLLVYLTRIFGFKAFLLLYFFPYMVVNCLLVFITKLHHHDINVPHYNDATYTFLKGQLCTIDRSYGWLLDEILHNICDTHVVHHLFPRMPHYHTVEAGRAIKGLLGQHYHSNNSSIFLQNWNVFKECAYVEEQEIPGVYWFNNKLRSKCS